MLPFMRWRKKLTKLTKLTKLKKCSSRVYEVSTLALQVSNIIIKVYNSLERLLIITFNIKAIRVTKFQVQAGRQVASQCPHLEKFALRGIRSLHLISQPNLYIFKKASVIVLYKETLESFRLTFSMLVSFSQLALPTFLTSLLLCQSQVLEYGYQLATSTCKMIGGVTYRAIASYMLTACLTAQQVPKSNIYIVASYTLQFSYKNWLEK